MAEQKHKKHIVTGLKLPENIKSSRPPDLDRSETLVSWLDNSVVEGASQMVCLWYLQATPDKSYPAHTHDTDEIVGFFGSDPHNPHKLAGEIEIWLEDEQYLIDESCLIFVPKGMRHCPLIIRKVSSPIFHFTAMIGGQYIRKDETPA
jgi:hypothetical protein